MPDQTAIVINTAFLVAAVLICLGYPYFGGLVVLGILKSCHDADLLP